MPSRWFLCLRTSRVRRFGRKGSLMPCRLRIRPIDLNRNFWPTCPTKSVPRWMDFWASLTCLKAPVWIRCSCSIWRLSKIQEVLYWVSSGIFWITPRLRLVKWIFMSAPFRQWKKSRLNWRFWVQSRRRKKFRSCSRRNSVPHSWWKRIGIRSTRFYSTWLAMRSSLPRKVGK